MEEAACLPLRGGNRICRRRSPMLLEKGICVIEGLYDGSMDRSVQ